MYIKIKIVYNNNDMILKENKANGCSFVQAFDCILNTGRGVEVYL